MNVSAFLTVVLAITVLLVSGLAGLGRCAVHDQALKQRTSNHLYGFVRHFLGVYTRGS